MLQRLFIRISDAVRRSVVVVVGRSAKRDLDITVVLSVLYPRPIGIYSDVFLDVCVSTLHFLMCHTFFVCARNIVTSAVLLPVLYPRHRHLFGCLLLYIYGIRIGF